MILNGLRVRAFALLSLLVVCSGAFAVAPINAVGPAENKAAIFTEKKAPATLALPATAPATRIALPAPSDAERGLVKARNAKLPTTLKQMTKGAKSRPLAIGYGRTIATASQRIALAALPWQTLSDGSRAAKVQIVSPDAAALRVALQLAATDPDLSVSFSGNAPNAEVFGPVPANTIADDTARFGVFWSPTLDGDVATIEFHADAGAKIGGVTLTIPRIAHHLITGAALKSPDLKTVGDIGSSAACNIDVACVVPQTAALSNAAKAVAQMLITWSTGDSILCTGTLLNDSITSGTPYFLVANHCLDEDTGPRSTNGAASARTINTYWFFDAVACGNHTTIPPYVQQAAGASLLARSEDWDWGLVRLNVAPPPGTFFSAWNSGLVTAGSTVSVIHHPEGDLKKWASGNSPGYQSFDDGSSFIQARYSQGTTEGGSSGSSLLTLNGGGFYEVRGGLFGGLASCQDPSGLDIYSRLDNLLPLVRQYLTPATIQAAPWSPSSSTTRRSSTISFPRRRTKSTTSTPVCTWAGNARDSASSRTQRRFRERARSAASIARRTTATRISIRRAPASARPPPQSTRRLDLRSHRTCSTFRYRTRRRAPAQTARCRCGAFSIN
jgi:hypothetical protein